MEVVKLVPDDMEKAVKGTEFGYGRVYFDDGSSHRYLGDVYHADKIYFRFYHPRGWRMMKEMGEAVQAYVDRQMPNEEKRT